MTKCWRFISMLRRLLISVFLLLPLVLADNRHDYSVVDLTAETFDLFVESHTTLVDFFAPWCPHCQHLAPLYHNAANAWQDYLFVTASLSQPPAISASSSSSFSPSPSSSSSWSWSSVSDEASSSAVSDLLGGPPSAELMLLKKLGPSEIVSLAKVDCVSQSSLCRRFEIRGYPTLRLFTHHSSSTTQLEFTGPRTTDAILHFTVNFASANAPIRPMPPKDSSIVPKAIIDRNDWRDSILKSRAKSASSQATGVVVVGGGVDGEGGGGAVGDQVGHKPLQQLQQQVQLQLQQQQAVAAGVEDGIQQAGVQAGVPDAVGAARSAALQQESTSTTLSYVTVFGCLSIAFLVAVVWLVRYSRVVTEDEKIV